MSHRMSKRERRTPNRLTSLLIAALSRAARPQRREDFAGDLYELRSRSPHRGAWIPTAFELALAMQHERVRLALATLLLALDPRSWRPVPSDLRASLRRLGREPAFTALALSTIGGGIACITIATALVRGVLFVELPYQDPEDLVALFTTERQGAELRNPTSPADFLAWQSRTGDTLESMTAARPWSPTLTASDTLLKLDGVLATASLFELLGTPPLVGRAFDGLSLADEHRPVVLSYGLARRLSSVSTDPGSVIRLDGEPYRVAAVMPEGFVFPPFWADEAELWAPLDLSGEIALDRDSRYLRVFARLADGVTAETAQGQLESVMTGITEDSPQSYEGIGARLEPLREPTVSESRPALLALLGASVAVIALVAFNLASLLVAQRLQRSAEMHLRAALGASAPRLRLAVFWETALLTLLGAGAGVVIAIIVLPLLRAHAQASLPVVASIQIDIVTVAIAALVTLALTTLVAFPGMVDRTTRDGALRVAGGLVAARQRRLLVALQLAATVALLVTAGLMVRSFAELSHVDPGFRADRVAAARIDISQSAHGEDDRQAAFYQALERALEQRPEIEAAGLVNHLPIEGDLWRTRVFAPGISSPDDDVRAAIRVASPGYLDSLGLELIAGRWIDDSDSQGSLTVVINREAAETLWPGSSPTGRELALDSLTEQGTRRRVIGVVDNVKQTGLGSEVIPEIYLPLSRNPFPFVTEMTVVARTSNRGGVIHDSAGVLARATRQVLGDLAPAVPVYATRSLDDVLAVDLSSDRLLSRTVAGFALAALALAGFGLFAVVSYAAASRNRELAVRLALGSTRTQLAAVVVREGVATALIGITSGLALASLSTAGLAPLLYGIRPLDLSTYALIGGGAALVSLAAIAIPAVRASVRLTVSSLRA